jgi:hypothetical protein
MASASALYGLFHMYHVAPFLSPEGRRTPHSGVGYVDVVSSPPLPVSAKGTEIPSSDI